MSKPLKNLITQELKTRYDGLDSLLIVNPIGIEANDTVELRRGLREKNIRMEVVKNSMLKRALIGTTLEVVSEILEGPCAIVSGGDSIVDAAREIVEWSKKFPTLEFRGAVVEGQLLDTQAAKELAKMPTRPELMGQVVQLAQSPGARLAGALISPAAKIAGCIKTLQEKLEQAESQAA